MEEKSLVLVPALVSRTYEVGREGRETVCRSSERAVDEAALKLGGCGQEILWGKSCIDPTSFDFVRGLVFISHNALLSILGIYMCLYSLSPS